MVLVSLKQGEVLPLPELEALIMTQCITALFQSLPEQALGAGTAVQCYYFLDCVKLAVHHEIVSKISAEVQMKP